MGEGLAKRLALIREQLDQASVRWGKPPRIIAVSKTIAAEEINLLAALDVLDLGENRVQEIMEKAPMLYPKFRMHLIGRLQTNKVKYIINKVCFIHSLDRMELAQEISRHAQKAGLVMNVLVQVNVAGEAQKGGINSDETERFIRDCALMPGICVRGLMAIMPLTADVETLRPLFREMRSLFDSISQMEIPGVYMEELSMGMSQDYLIAAQEGATMVRIGSALFGARSPKATNK